MSPLWREEVHVLVTPTEITLVRFKKGIRPALVAKTALPIMGQSAKGSPVWIGPLQTLNHILATDEWARGDLAVVLSNHFARYRVVPWQDELRDKQELTAYAERVLRQTYGRDCADWSVVLNIDRAGSPFLACAVETALIEELKASAAQQKRRLVSVRPLLMEAFNVAKGWLPGTYSWLAIVEEGLICAALVGKGRWVVVRTVRTSDNWPGELVALLEREQFLVDEADSAQTVLLHVVNGSCAELPATRWTVRPVHSALVRETPASVLSCVR